MALSPYFATEHLPRPVVEPGNVMWLGGCSDRGLWGKKWAAADLPRKHVYCNSYVISGAEKVLMVETGHGAQWQDIRAELAQAIGNRPVDYIFPTHQEIPHAGNLGRLLDLYPEAIAVGDVRDYHVHFPEVDRSRLVMKKPGDVLDLGGSTFTFKPSLWHDLPSTLWGFTAPANVLFVVDALEYSHLHGRNHCGLLSWEIPEADIPDSRVIGGFMGHVKMQPRIALLRSWATDLQAAALCPSHGAPVTGNIPAMLTKLLEEAALAGSDSGNPEQARGTLPPGMLARA